MTSPKSTYPARYEVKPVDRLAATIRPPGSKSLTNRALMVAALAIGRSRIGHPLVSEDTAAMRSVLSGLGVAVEGSPDTFVVSATGELNPDGSALHAMASGTTARFVTAAATIATGPTKLDGAKRLQERPIGPLVDALRQLGASIAYGAANGFLPLKIRGGGLGGGMAIVDASSSSQFVSAVLMAAARARQATRLTLVGSIVSRPYIDNTIEVMGAFGGRVGWTADDTLEIEPSGYTATDYEVEPDASAAVYPWAAAAVTGGKVRVEGLGKASTQPDMGALAVLEAMGCEVEMADDHVTLSGPDRLMGADVDVNHCPDAVVGLAVVAAFAGGPSLFRNIGNLRIKETDRLAALETELAKLGAGATAGPDWLAVEPGPMHGAHIRTYDDHRIAMAFSIAGLVVGGVTIQDPACVAKTWPGFFDWLETL